MKRKINYLYFFGFGVDLFSKRGEGMLGLKNEVVCRV